VRVFEELRSDSAAFPSAGLYCLVSILRAHATREYNLAIIDKGTGTDVHDTAATKQDYSRRIKPSAISVVDL
jgi:hypothetical protein